MYWRLNRIQWPVFNLGPGCRIGIWVQGCSIHCQECISKSLWSFDDGKEILIPELAMEILKLSQKMDGITITGGEPFDQYQSLISFCAFIKRKSNLTILCFSGYYLQELLDKFPDHLFLRYVDFLIDGRYEKDKPANDNLRGSLNQTIYQIENCKPRILKSYSTSKKWSIAIKSTEEIFLTGIPKKGEMAKIIESINTKQKKWRLE